MMGSVKFILKCIGIDTSGNVSLLTSLFGFIIGRVPADPTGVTTSVSILDHINSLQGNHIHLNIIKTGLDLFTGDEVKDIDYAIFKTRNIYRSRSLGVGRVLHFFINSFESNGLHIIASEDDAEQLTHNWTIDNNAIDVFVVHRIIKSAGFVGLSPVEGPFDKDDKNMNGIVCDKDRGADATARTMAHEIGHYLGLEEHLNSEPNNLMCQTNFASSVRDSVILTNGQGVIVNDHNFVRNGC